MIKLLGDVHLGKRFKNNVPLHRRGDREAMQWAQFEAHLNYVDSTGDVHIQVGDLFDEAIVPFGVIYRAARAYTKAANAHPLVTYILYRGNHDASRDVEKVSAFQMFKLILAGMVDRDQVKIYDDYQGELVHEGVGHVFIPWHPIKTSRELVEEAAPMIQELQAEGLPVTVYGHWDVDRRQGGGDNYIPAAELAALGVKRIVTGHDHLKRDEVIAGVDGHVTGSMQPYDHSQDPAGELYVSRTLSEVLQAPDGAFRDLNLKLFLTRDEVLDVPVDCLSLIVVREGREEDDSLADVEFETFDLDQLLAASIAKVGLRADIAERVREKVAEEKLHDDDQNV